MDASTASLPGNWLDEFKATMSEAGITPPDFISETDKFDRFPIGNKKGKSGFCNFVNMGTYAYGIAGDWATGVKVKWSSHSKETTDTKTWETIRHKIEADQAKAEKEKKEGQEKIAKDARRVFDAAKPATIEHPYLKRKLGLFAGLAIQGLNVDYRGNLMIPMRDINGAIHNIEYVSSKEPKDTWRHYIKGEKGISGRGDGLFFGFHGTNDCFLCEGYSTGATIHQATGATVICCFNAGNMPKVAAEFKAAYSHYKFKVCADNDLWRDDGKNPGAEKGQETAKILGCDCILPVFKDTATKPTDFNDLAVLEGLDTVRAQVVAIDQQISQRRQFGFVRAGDLEMKTPDCIIKPILESDAVAVLFGGSGTMKTFLALDMVCCISTGADFHGMEIRKPGPVLYIAGEGHNGLRRRLKAWEIRRQISIDNAPLFISNMPARLTDDDSVQAVISQIRIIAEKYGNPILVVVDTLARNFGGGDENATKDMSTFVNNLDMIRAEYRFSVLVVHHTGHQDQSRARGNKALLGAIDAEYRTEKDDTGTVRLYNTKMKEGPELAPMAFKVASVDLGIIDEDGEPVTSAILNPVDYTPSKKDNAQAKGKNQLKALAIIKDLLQAERDRISENGGSFENAKILIEEVRFVFMEDGAHRNTWYKIKKWIDSHMLIKSDTTYIYDCP